MNKIKNIISTLLTIVLVAIALLFAAPKIFGITPTAVLSGSMEPVYPVGSLIFVQKTTPETLNVEDIITFSMGEGNTAVTHRIIDIDTENKEFYTKGDNNNVADGSPVSYQRLIGKASTFAIPFLGYFAVFMSTQTGIILMGGIVLVLLLLTFLPDSKKDKKA